MTCAGGFLSRAGKDTSHGLATTEERAQGKVCAHAESCDSLSPASRATVGLRCGCNDFAEVCTSRIVKWDVIEGSRESYLSEC